MADFNTTISQIRSLLGDHRGLLEFIHRLPQPLEPELQEYLEAHVGAWGERKVEFRYRIRRRISGLYSEGGMDPNFGEKGKVWKLGPLMGHLAQFGPQTYEQDRKSPYDGCEIVEERVVSYTHTMGAFDLTGDLEPAKDMVRAASKERRKKEKAEQRRLANFK